MSETPVTLDALLAQVEKTIADLLSIKDQLKQLAKAQKRKRVSSAPKKNVVVKVTPAFDVFLQSQSVASDGYTRPNMMKVICSYVKTNKLQVEGKLQSWKPDETLSALFDIPSIQVCQFIDVNKLLSKVIVKQ